MGYICTRCGGTNVACEAIVNPNTGKIIDYFDGSFMHAICSNCENEVGVQMLLPRGADKCPECSSKDTLMWVDENRQEMDAKHLDCLVPIRKLELQEYLSPEILKMEHI